MKVQCFKVYLREGKLSIDMAIHEDKDVPINKKNPRYSAHNSSVYHSTSEKLSLLFAT